MLPSELSKISSTEAWPMGLRALDPLKITSVSDSPRKYLGELSPMTQVTASIMLDLPQPLGPTMATSLLGKEMVVGSTKDLNPEILIFESCIHCVPIDDKPPIPNRKTIAAIPAKKRGNGFLVFMLRKSKAFACTKGGEPRSPPLESPIAKCSAGIAETIAYYASFLLMDSIC